MNRVLVTRNPLSSGYAAFEFRDSRVFAVNVARRAQTIADLQYDRTAFPAGTVFQWVLPGTRLTWCQRAREAAVKLWRQVR